MTITRIKNPINAILDQTKIIENCKTNIDLQINNLRQSTIDQVLSVLGNSSSNLDKFHLTKSKTLFGRKVFSYPTLVTVLKLRQAAINDSINIFCEKRSQLPSNIDKILYTLHPSYLSAYKALWHTGLEISYLSNKNRN